MKVLILSLLFLFACHNEKKVEKISSPNQDQEDQLDRFFAQSEIALNIIVKMEERLDQQTKALPLFAYVRVFDREFPELQLYMFRKRKLAMFKEAEIQKNRYVFKLGRIWHENFKNFVRASELHYHNSIVEIGFDGRKGASAQMPLLDIIKNNKTVSFAYPFSVSGIKDKVEFRLSTRIIPLTAELEIKREEIKAKLSKRLSPEHLERLRKNSFGDDYDPKKHAVPIERTFKKLSN